MIPTQDFIINQGGELTGEGPVANLLGEARYDVGLLRPYINEDDGWRPTVTINSGKTVLVQYKNKRTGVITNKREPEKVEVRVRDLEESGVQLPDVTRNARLRKEEWIMYDEALIPPQVERLRIFDDVASISTFSFPGLGVKMLEHETVSKMGRVYMDMDMRSEETDDAPLFQLEGEPIPVMHGAFNIDIRTLESSRRRGTPLSTLGVSEITRRLLEMREDVSLGLSNPLLWGDATQVSGYGRTPGVYGFLNYPDRMTKTDLTIPTGSNPEATVQDVLEMRDQMYANNFYGPYGLYVSTDWDAYLDNDYARLGGNNASMTLRERLLRIGTESGNGSGQGSGDIKWIKRIDRLLPSASHAFTMIMVNLTSGTVRALNGMPLTIFQYEVKGGIETVFRVAMIQRIQLMSDYYDKAGVLQARTA